MTEYIVSRYNNNMDWMAEYTPSMILYDRGDEPTPGSIIVPNIGTDIADKLHFIITNYFNRLPDIGVYCKGNLFKYISKKEFDNVKNNTVFTPLLKQDHKVYKDDKGKDVCFYKDGIYWEINNMWYLGAHPCKHDPKEVMKFCGIDKMEYVPFAPGSNYILPKEHILKRPREFYMKLYEYVNWSVYPAEAQIIERSLYTIWK